jgi:hypothetical protein
MLRTLTFALLFLVSNASAQTTFNQEYMNGNTQIISHSTLENADGSFLIAGNADTSINGLQGGAGFIKKTNPAGIEQWTKYYTFPGTFGVELNKIIKTADSNYVVVGSIDFGFGIGPTFVDALICKVDTAGNLLWAKWYGDVGTDAVKDIREMPNGDLQLFVSYGKEENLFVYNTYQIITTNSNGDSIWSKQYYRNDQQEQFPFSFSETSDSGLILSGEITNNNGTGNGFLIKTDSVGDTLWTYTLNPNTSSNIFKVISANGSFFLIGNMDMGFNDWKIIISNHTNSGIINWQATLNETNLTVFSAVRSQDGGFALACMRSDSLGDKEIILKTDSLGVKLWELEIPLTTLYLPTDIITTSDSSLVVTGYSNLTSINAIHFTKISGTGSTTGIDPTGTISTSFIYPNPASNSITIQYHENKDRKSHSLYFLNTQGQLLKEISLQETRSSEIDISELNPGVYILVLEGPDKNVVSHFKLIKE